MTEPARPIPTGPEIAWALATYAGRALKSLIRSGANIGISVLIVWLLFFRGALPPVPVPNPPVPPPPPRPRPSPLGLNGSGSITAAP